MRYCLLDERRIATDEQESLRNLAAALFRLEKSRGIAEIEATVTALLEWLQAPEQVELKRSFAAWVVQVLLPARARGAQIPVVTELEEVKSMLAERVKEWPREWKREGLKEGRAVLIRELERRFGPLPPEARQSLEVLDSYERIVELSFASATAPSLAALELDQARLRSKRRKQRP